MFRCAEGHTSKPGEKQVKVVVEAREKTYTTPRGGVSRGWEIVQELVFCTTHAGPTVRRVGR